MNTKIQENIKMHPRKGYIAGISAQITEVEKMHKKIR